MDRITILFWLSLGLMLCVIFALIYLSVICNKLIARLDKQSEVHSRILRATHYSYLKIILTLCQFGFGADDVLIYTKDASDEDDGSDEGGPPNVH